MVSTALYRDNPRSRAVRRLREWIADGTLALGSELPSERDLAERLDLPRPTVNRALAELMEEGLIRQGQGRSRFVAAAPSAGIVGQTVVLLAPPLGDDHQPQSTGGIDWIVTGAQAAVRAHGWHCLTIEIRSLPTTELMALAGGGYLGLLLGPVGIGSRSEPEEFVPVIAAFQAAGIPVVAFGDEAPGLLDRVVPDHRRGARALVATLVAAGHRRLWQVAERGAGVLPWWVERRAGYEEGMRDAGLEPLPVIELPPAFDEGDFAERALAMVGHLLPAIGPTAHQPADVLLALNDHHALLLARACRLLGRTVPIAGYDAMVADLKDLAEEPGGPQWTVDPCWWDCGRALVQVLAARRRLGPDAPLQRQLVTPRVC